MRLLSAAEYAALIDGATLLRADGFGPKVYETRDGQIVKLFRIKRWWSSSTLYPYSLRFRRNSRRLQRRGYRCATIDQVFYCHAVRRHGIVYRKMHGEPLDTLLDGEDARGARVFRDYAAFVARLHADRIYFRSLHPGNVLLMDDGGYGLIDVGDMRFPRFALTLDRRRRNFRHLLRSVEFNEALRHYPADTFIDAYLDAAVLPADQSRQLRVWLREDFKRTAEASS